VQELGDNFTYTDSQNHMKRQPYLSQLKSTAIILILSHINQILGIS